MSKVKMLVEISGLRNGRRWPGRGEVADVPSDEAEALIAQRYAEAVASKKTTENECDECGFEAKNAAGLAVHQRSHEE